jgi:hypothetical protein
MKNQYKIVTYKNREYIVVNTDKNENEPFVFYKDLLNVCYYMHNTGR